MIPKHTFEKLLKIYDELSKSHHELSKEQNTIYKIGIFIDTMVDFREGVYQLVTYFDTEIIDSLYKIKANDYAHICEKLYNTTQEVKSQLNKKKLEDEKYYKEYDKAIHPAEMEFVKALQLLLNEDNIIDNYINPFIEKHSLADDVLKYKEVLADIKKEQRKRIKEQRRLKLIAIDNYIFFMLMSLFMIGCILPTCIAFLLSIEQGEILIPGIFWLLSEVLILGLYIFLLDEKLSKKINNKRFKILVSVIILILPIVVLVFYKSVLASTITLSVIILLYLIKFIHLKRKKKSTT